MRWRIERTTSSRGRLVAGWALLALTGAVVLGLALDLVDARGTHREGTRATATVEAIEWWHGRADGASVVVPVEGRAVATELSLTGVDAEVAVGDEIEVLWRRVDGELVAVAADEDLGTRALWVGAFGGWLAVAGVLFGALVAGWQVTRPARAGG